MAVLILAPTHEVDFSEGSGERDLLLLRLIETLVQFCDLAIFHNHHELMVRCAIKQFVADQSGYNPPLFENLYPAAWIGFDCNLAA